MPNAGFATRRVLEPLIRDFERRKGDVKVRLEVLPWSLGWARLMDVIKGRYEGPKPDVVQVGTTWVATLAFLGALETVPESSVFPVSDRQSAYIWDPGAQTEPAHELFCVPWFIDVRVLYYRRDLFERLGIPDEWLQDWKGLFKACMEIKRFLSRSGPVPRVVAPIALSGQSPGVMMHDVAPWIWGAGGDFCADDLSLATLNRPEAARGCEFYYDLINQGFMGDPSGAVTRNLPGIGFFTGHYAMQFSGAWPISTYLNPAWEYASKEVIDGFGTALMPAGPSGRYSFLGGSNLAVTSSSDKKDAAWELVTYLSEPERQLTHARSIGALTARLSSLEKLFDNFPRQKKIFWDSLGHARRLPRLVELGSVEQIIFSMGNKVLRLIRSGQYNHRRLQEALAAANDGVDSTLSLHRYGAGNGSAAS